MHATPSVLILSLLAMPAHAVTVDVCETGCAYDNLAEALDDPTVTQIDLLAGNYELSSHDHLYDVDIVGPTSAQATITCLGGPCTESNNGANVSWSNNIRFHSDVVASSVFQLDAGSSLTLDGVSTNGRDAGGRNGGFIYATGDSSVAVRNMTIGGLIITGTGGAIWASSSDVVLDNVTIENCRAGVGGAVAVFDGSLEIVGGTVRNNQANALSGGAVYCENCTTVDLTNSDFDNNEAAFRGGHVYVTTAAVTVEQSSFTGGQTVERGGALQCVDCATVDIIDTLIDGTRSTTSSPGGMNLYGTGGDITITRLDCRGTQGATGATNVGGCLRIEESQSSALTVTGGTFHNNNTGGAGGAIHVDGIDAVTITGNVFEGNRGSSGGAVALTQSNVNSPWLIADNDFIDNRAQSGPGAAVLVYDIPSGVDLEVDDNDFTGNQTASIGAHGGAIALTSFYTGTTGRIEHNVFCNNQAGQGKGGALYVDPSSTTYEFDLRYNVFAHNLANDGGAVYLANGAGDVVVENNHVLDNSANAGGGIYWAAGHEVVFRNNLMAYNDGTSVVYKAGTATEIVLQDYNAWEDNGSNWFGGYFAGLGTNSLDLVSLGTPPMLADFTKNDPQCDTELYYPMVGSPIIDAGDPSTVIADDPPDIGAMPGITSATLDDDGDGYPADVDCNDADADVKPGATEVCNGLDDDCDGTIDNDDTTDGTTYFRDVDNDSYGNPASAVVSCSLRTGLVDNSLDCDDADDTINPEADEICDGLDNDCNGSIDDALTYTTWYTDGDGDGFGDPSTGVVDCTAADNQVDNDLDCDDSDADVNPDAVEIPDDGIDNDCIDGDATVIVPPVDADGDGCPDAAEGQDCQDCDDSDPDVHPGAEEVPHDGVDNDCDGIQTSLVVGGAGCACDASRSSRGGWLLLGLGGLLVRRRQAAA